MFSFYFWAKAQKRKREEKKGCGLIIECLRYANGIDGVIVCEQPVLVAFSSFPEGIHGDRDDLDLVIVYDSSNWDASIAVSRLDRLGYIDSSDNDQEKYGDVKNPALYGMTGKNIKWAGIYHS